MLNNKKNSQNGQKPYPKAMSCLICFFNPVSKAAVQDSLNKAQSSLDRADDLIKKSEDLNREVNLMLATK